MSVEMKGLVELLTLQRIDQWIFVGQSQDLGWGTVYGGQVLGQALAAAIHTVPSERPVHSLHASFLLPGDVGHPIVYQVDPIRDGGSFSTRRVVAVQHGKAIFHLSASFHEPEVSVAHQDVSPTFPEPSAVPSDHERWTTFAATLPPAIRERLIGWRPFEFRTVGAADDHLSPSTAAPHRQVLMKTAAELPNEPWLHACLLAYASDYSFLTTALLPHGVTWLTPGMKVASLDHAMWFHAPFRIDQWLLHDMDSPWAGVGRALVRGRVFDTRGTLVASTAQEGLTRTKRPR